MREVKKKILGFALVLLFVAMLAAPMVGTAEAWGCRRGPTETFDTVLLPDFVPILTAEGKYIPSMENPCMVIFKWDEIMLDYTITVDGKEYKLHQDFEYSGKAVVIAIGPQVVPMPSPLAPADRTFFIVNYVYDFSAVPGGLEGKIRMFAFSDSDNPPMKIRSLWGTGDFRCVRIRAEGKEVGLGHIGTVSGWP